MLLWVMLIFIWHIKTRSETGGKCETYSRENGVASDIHPSKSFLILFSEMDHGFPWVLAAKYFMSGIGCVIGILSAAMASFAMRELKESLEEKTFLPVRKISNLSTTQIEHQPSRKTSHVPVIIEEPSNLHIIEERPLQQLVSITECTSNGIIETSFP